MHSMRTAYENEIWAEKKLKYFNADLIVSSEANAKHTKTFAHITRSVPLYLTSLVRQVFRIWDI